MSRTKNLLISIVLAFAIAVFMVPAAQMIAPTSGSAPAQIGIVHAASQKAKAKKLVGKTVKLSVIKSKVGKWKKFYKSSACTNGRYSGKLKYNGFCIYISSKSGKTNGKWKVARVK